MKRLYAISAFIACYFCAVSRLWSANPQIITPNLAIMPPAVATYADSTAVGSSKVMVCISAIHVLNIRFPKIPLIDFWHVCLTMPDGSCLGFYPQEQAFRALVKATVARVKGWFTIGEPEKCFTTNYNAETVKTAITHTQSRYKHYNLFFKNCQHFVNDVLTECEKLTKQHKP